MRFGRVQGHGRLVTHGGQPLVSLAVMLDSGSSVTIVRDEQVPWLAFGPADDLVWQIDQLTQETIGTTLAEEGWEPFSEDESGRVETSDGLSHSAVYVVRNMGSAFGYGGEVG
ncbi:MAG TPA: hypothetical protein VEQ36_09490 [Thermomicrobiales bacterium]|nr:hypothetical protein [Thermomicrobiales bacterium]